MEKSEWKKISCVRKILIINKKIYEKTLGFYFFTYFILVLF